MFHVNFVFSVMSLKKSFTGRTSHRQLGFVDVCGLLIPDNQPCDGSVRLALCDIFLRRCGCDWDCSHVVALGGLSNRHVSQLPKRSNRCDDLSAWLISGVRMHVSRELPHRVGSQDLGVPFAST